MVYELDVPDERVKEWRALIQQHLVSEEYQVTVGPNAFSMILASLEWVKKMYPDDRRRQEEMIGIMGFVSGMCGWAAINKKEEATTD